MTIIQFLNQCYNFVEDLLITRYVNKNTFLIVLIYADIRKNYNYH